MISIQNNTSPIEIGILEVSSQNRAVLSFFIDSIGADIFKEVDLDQASAFIIDFDFPGAKESWKELQSTKKPAIILSVKEVIMPGSIWVKKPLTAKELTNAGQKINAMINKNLVQPITEAVDLGEVSSTQTLKIPSLNNLPNELASIEKSDLPALTTLETSPDSMPAQITESIATLESEPVLSADTINLSPHLNDDLANTLTLDASQSTAEIVDVEMSTASEGSGIDELDSLLNDLHSEPLTSEGMSNNENVNEVSAAITLADSVPALATVSASALKPSPTKTATKQTAVSSDITDTLTLEIRADSIQSTSEVDETETTELDSLLSDLHTESQASAVNDVRLPSLEPQVEIEPVELLSDTNEPDFFNELIIGSSPDAPQEIQPNEQSTIIDDENIPDKVGDSDLSTDANLATEVTEKVAESYAEATDGDLEAMLDELQQEMGGGAGGGAATNSNINASSSDGTTQRTYQGTQAQERWALLCGDKKLVRNASDIKKTAFTLNEHFLSSLLKTVKEGKATKQIKRIKYNDLLIIIDHEADTIYSDLSIYSDEYAQICFDPVESKKMRIHSLDDSEIRMLHQQIKSDPENVYTTEAFIWTTSLLTSRGRLLKSTNTNKPVGLKSWPNLTRIESFPHMMNIAAVFSKNPGNLLEVSKWLNIPQCYVFAFYNAAFFLDMIDFDSNEAGKNTSRKLSFNFGTKKKSENSGLFSRLLNKIKG